jgi:uncharacterized protein
LIRDLKYFLYKLISPRPTFPQDITQEEQKIMASHVDYWKQLAERRTTLIFGPVLDPKGVYGLAIVEAQEETLVENIGYNDPAIKASMGFRFEIYPFIDAVLRG